MLKETLQQVTQRLNDYLNYKLSTSAIDYVVLSHLSESNESIHVNLVNVEEDKVYKNHLNPESGRLSNSTDDIHPYGGIPVIRVNLYVLFAFNPKTGQISYLDALSLLNRVLGYFAATPAQEIIIPAITDNGNIITPEKRMGVEINYHNISLEDSNNMWSNLGGEQKPYAMYQIKMLEIEGDTHIPLLKNKVIKEPQSYPVQIMIR